MITAYETKWTPNKCIEDKQDFWSAASDRKGFWSGYLWQKVFLTKLCRQKRPLIKKGAKVAFDETNVDKKGFWLNYLGEKGLWLNSRKQ